MICSSGSGRPDRLEVYVIPEAQHHVTLRTATSPIMNVRSTVQAEHMIENQDLTLVVYDYVALPKKPKQKTTRLYFKGSEDLQGHMELSMSMPTAVGVSECPPSSISFLDDDIFSLLLDEFGASAPPGALIENPTLQVVQQPIKKRRRRPRDELEDLRKSVSELEDRLASMHLLAAGRDDNSEDTDWREIALRQRRQAEIASETNAQLRAMMKDHRELASDLHAMVMRHLKLARIEGPTLVRNLHPAPPPTHYDVRTSPKLFETLANDLDVVRSRLESVFSTAAFDSRLNDVSMRNSSLLTDNDGTFFEILHSERFPFRMEALHRAVGASIAHNTSKYPYTTLKQVDEDTIQYAFSELVPSTHITMTSKMVIRRRIENGRVVLIWTGVVEIEGGMAIQAREDGWAIAEPQQVTTQSPSMVVRNVVRITPELSASSTEEKRQQAGDMTDTVFDAYRWLITLINQSHENAMIREMQGKR